MEAELLGLGLGMCLVDGRLVAVYWSTQCIRIGGRTSLEGEECGENTSSGCIGTC